MCTGLKTIQELLDDLADEEHDQMLDRLMKNRGIEAGDYKSLAYQLAIEHVPGFRPPWYILEHGDYGAVIRHSGKGGRPTKWTPEELDKLLSDVDDAKRRHGRVTDEEALRYITRRGKWRCLPGRDPTKWRKTLKNLLAAERRAERDAGELARQAQRHLVEGVERIRCDNPENPAAIVDRIKPPDPRHNSTCVEENTWTTTN